MCYCDVAKMEKVDKLAGYVVDRTTFLINGIIDAPLSQEILQSLDIFEQYATLVSTRWLIQIEES
ncbi:hypothetical protein C8R44DRAFT_769030 [Mycena epipterygia]|nr:hypothetical protein C8R44DRAFT_769030 [Mycena epipterygia]